MNREQISALIRDVPDFPKPGILFKDIAPLLANAAGFAATIDALAELVAQHKPDALAGIESRGFIFGAALATKMQLPLQLVRKKGKLPFKTVSMDYDLEYGTDTIEMHVDAVSAGTSYAIIDDLIATGGTAGAAARLIEKQGGKVACAAFVIELEFLRGRDKFSDECAIETVLRY